ncbi:MAG: hypothetical protein AAFO69_14390 [Bacteroidota bacterium]
MENKLIATLIEIIGWTGSVEVILAYALVSYGKIKGDSPVYQWLNLTGGVFLIVHTIVHRAYPSTFINLVWVAIAIIALWNIQKRKNKASLTREVD